MKIQLGGKYNSYTATLNVSGKTLTIAGVIGFDLTPRSLASIWDASLGTPAFIPVTGITVANIPVNGLPVWVYTFPSLPAGVANGDSLVILLDIPETIALGSQITGGNIDAQVVSLSAVTVSGVSADQTNYNGKGIQLVVDVTALTGTTPSIVVTIQGKDTTSGKYYNILTSASITTVSTNQLSVYPGSTVTANVSSSQPLPKTWRISYTIAGTTPAITATIGASIIV